MYLSCLLIDTGKNPDRPRPGRRWLQNLYRVHQRLCMAFPSPDRVEHDPEFLKPFVPEDFADNHVHVPRARDRGFLYRVDPCSTARAIILVQSAIKPNWNYAFHNASHLLAAPPQSRDYKVAPDDGMAFRFRLRANTVRRIKTDEDGKDGPRVPVPPTEEHLNGWLDRRAERAGFRIEERSNVVPGYVYVNKTSSSNQGVRLRSVVFEGTLIVTDSARFAATLASGIGPAKAFGFGLLSIAPVR